MTRREAWISAAAVFGIALIVRAIASSLIVFPKPEDTSYYIGVARHLLGGEGLVSNSIWSFQTPPLVFPRPAFEVWLPLPTFLAAVPMALFGSTFGAAQMASVVVGAIVPVLAWRIGADVAAERGLPPGRARTLALGAGIAAAVYLPLVLHSTLPDSTMPFAVVGLGACILMSRVLAVGGAPRSADPRLLGLGVLIGLAALTRNEAIWIGIAWAVLAWALVPATPAERARVIVVPAVVALAIYAPWAYRNWVEFGSPFPGQAVSNALSVSGTDIFAWRDPPTLSKYLAQGPATLIQVRIDGMLHNLLNVLLIPGVPTAAIGLVVLPWAVRIRSLWPLAILGFVTFFATSLLFPVATTWGTFLHAAGPFHVLLVVSALLGLDALIAAVGRRRGWTNPVAWLGPALAVAGSILFTVVLLPTFGSSSRDTQRGYEALSREMAEVGLPMDSTLGPVITDHPIWIAEELGVPALALPDEDPDSILDLARTFDGTRTLIVHGDVPLRWPAVLDADEHGSACFDEIPLDDPALGELRAFRIICR